MTAKEVGLNSQESIVLKSLTGIGVTVFSLFMFMNWQKTLSEAKIAEQAQQAQEQVATIENTTPSSTSLVRSEEPVVEDSTPSISENSVATTATNSTETISENVVATESTGSFISSTVDTTSAMSPSVETPEVAAEITDPEMVASLNQKLYDQVDQAWQQTPSFSDDLVYKVQVQENGEIAEYTPLNEAAFNYLSEVPIDELYNEKAASLSKKVAHFLVVLTPSGRLQVNPWMGKN